MTGAQLFTYLQRRLAEQGISVPAARQGELYAYLTEGRDELQKALALAAPDVVKDTVTLEPDPASDRVYAFPAATKDALAILSVRELETGEILDPSAQLDQDAGHYEWLNPRRLRIAASCAPAGGVELVYVPFIGTEIDAATTEAEIGLPTPTHRAIGKFAAVLALTADEESDASVAVGLFERELQRLEELYGQYDRNGGMALRHALMASIGAAHGDTLY